MRRYRTGNRHQKAQILIQKVRGITLIDQHEVTVTGKAPLPFDYWYVNGSLAWDIGQSKFLQATGGITYDDKFFVAGAFASFTGPTHTSPNNLTYGVTIKFRTPGAELPLNF